MKKYGKYERMPDGSRAKQPEMKSVLLQTYFTSLVCLLLCVTMFFGTTYAWFTSEVTNTGNEIYVGTLKVGLYKEDGTNLATSESDTAKLFDRSIRWEPGYTALETIQIKNEGDLSSRYALTFTDGTIDGVTGDEKLAEIAQHFTVYVHEGDFNPENGDARPESFADIKASAEAENGTWRAVRMGTNPATLADILTRGFPVLSGNLEEKDEVDTYVIALHMDEAAGEGATYEECIELSQKLMGKKIGLNVKLTAYQRTHEEDAFNKDYDLKAHVTELGALDINATAGINESVYVYTMTLDQTYQFQPVETYKEWDDSTFRNYTADFVVWSEADIPANSVTLAGYYSLWCESLNKGNWVYLQAGEEIEANTEIRLVEAMGGGEIKVHYKDLCQYGNDGIGFLCGVKNLAEQNTGKVIIVELRMYDPENAENYFVAGRYEYTLETPNGTISPIS